MNLHTCFCSYRQHIALLQKYGTLGMYVEGFSEGFVVGWSGGTEQPGDLRKKTPLRWWAHCSVSAEVDRRPPIQDLFHRKKQGQLRKPVSLFSRLIILLSN